MNLIERIVTVCIADDHDVVRAGVRALLAAKKNIRIIAETNSGTQAVELAQKHRPDIFILDLAMPGLSGIEVIKKIRAFKSGILIIVLTMHTDTVYIKKSFGAGAAAYILKDDVQQDLIKAIEAVLTGERFISYSVGTGALNLMAEITEGMYSDLDSPLTRLTPRQRQVFELILKDKTFAEIGEALSISPRTVEVHKRMLMINLGLSSTNQLQRWAVETGIAKVNEDGDVVEIFAGVRQEK
jgi:DNA-binding NarL/FixJ family response regulator